MRPTYFQNKKIDMNDSIWRNFIMSSVGSLCSKVPCFLSHVSRRGYMMINRKLYLCFIFKLPFDSFEQHKALPLGPNNNWQS